MWEVLNMTGSDDRLIVAEDGEQALRLVRQTEPFTDSARPDLIFLDLNLPLRDGREALAEIKAGESLRRIPVIVLTSSEAERDIHNMYALRANCYVQKPGDLDPYPEVIAACMNFWLDVAHLPA
jgi:CheY-like chemotaxis protein